MPAIEEDESRFPLVVIRFNGVASDAEFEGYLDRQSARIARDQVNAIVIDARRAGATPAKQRRRQAQWMREHAATLARWSVGTAFVIDSAMVRGLLTAILWVQPMPTPHVIVTTMEQAESWARAKLAERGASF